MGEWLSGRKRLFWKQLYANTGGSNPSLPEKKNVYYNYNGNYSLCFKNTVQQNNLYVEKIHIMFIKVNKAFSELPPLPIIKGTNSLTL